MIAFIVLLHLACRVPCVCAGDVPAGESNTKYHLTISHVTTEDGLSNDSVTSIIQDRNGYMWFGTIYGLNRFDGYNFEIYKHQSSKDSLSDNWVKTIFQDRHGDIWVGTNTRLDRLDPDSGTFKHYNAGTEIYAIHEDSEGVVWIGGQKGLLKFKRETDNFDCYSIRGGPVTSTVKTGPSPIIRVTRKIPWD